MIDILSKLLLGASNNCAQLLSSPGRTDVDKSHLAGTWLDVGVPSFKNLSHIGTARKVLRMTLFAFTCLVYALQQPSFELLATIGDAISSFLKFPDSTTKCQGLLSSTEVRKEAATRDSSHDGVWRFTVMRWAMAAGAQRWRIRLSLCLLPWFTAVATILAVTDLKSTVFEMWSGSVGSFDVADTFFRSSSLLGKVLIANTPQIVVSRAYIFYNNIFTCMLLSRETSAFAGKRKYLRCTAPIGRQNATCSLQLPFRYSVPMMASMSILYWLTARSMFLIEISVYNIHGDIDQPRNISACSYAFQAIILALALGGIIIVALGVFATRKLTPDIPPIGSCSIAISAACHANPQEKKLGVLPLMYGVIPGSGRDRQGKELVGFSSRGVEPLVSGRAYYYRRTGLDWIGLGLFYQAMHRLNARMSRLNATIR